MNKNEYVLELASKVIKKLPANSKTLALLKNSNQNVNSLLSIVAKSIDIIPMENIQRLNAIVRENARINHFGFFIIDVMPDVQLNWHHVEWIELLHNKDYNVCINASRGLGKTFFWVECLCCWLAYRYDKKSNIVELTYSKCLVYSVNQDLADEKIVSIVNRIIENPILNKRLYNPKKYKGKSITTTNGFNIRSFGMNTKTRGKHVPYIIMDDILADNTLYSADYRNKTFTLWAAAITPQLNENGKMIIIGTPMHSDDLYGRLKLQVRKEGLNYKVREYPAILPDGRLCWAWQRSKNYLAIQRKTVGELIFAQEYLCRPMSDGSSIFPYKYLNSSKDDSYSYVNNIKEFGMYEMNLVEFVVSGSDFAISGAASADFTTHVVFAVTKNGHFYLLNISREKGLGYKEQMDCLRFMESMFKPDLMAVENNNFQRIFEDMYKDMYQNSPIKGFTTTTNKNDYKNGLPSLCVLFERGMLHFPYKTEEDIKMTNIILSEFNSIGFTDKGLKSTNGHDDIPFAIWKAKQAFDEVSRSVFNSEYITI